MVEKVQEQSRKHLMKSVKNNSVVLAYSGGMDSTVLLYDAAKRFDEVHTISFDYGQRHLRELECAQWNLERVPNAYRKRIDVSYIKDIAPGSSLTNINIDNPNIREMAGDAQPISYVPFRNMMFLSIASSYAESIGANTVLYGCAQADSLAGYWDSSPEWIKSVNTLLSLNRKSKICVEAPLLEKSKKEIILDGIKLGVDFGKTWTCYSNRSDGLADADTPSSSLRLRGFIEAGYRDPIKYIQQNKLEEIYKKNKCKYTKFDTPIH